MPWARDMWARLLRERRLHHEHHQAFGPLIGSVVWVAYVERTSEWNLAVGCDGVFRIGCLAPIQPVRDPRDLKLFALWFVVGQKPRAARLATFFEVFFAVFFAVAAGFNFFPSGPRPVLASVFT